LGMLRTNPIGDARTPDFHALFDALPGLYLVLRPDDPVFTIITVNKAYSAATMTDAQSIVGLGLFDVFPDNPEDPDARGVRNVSNSFRKVIATKASHRMPPLKYDIRRPSEKGGEFEERYWSAINSPLLDDDGELQFIVHCVEDVTELVRLRRIEQEKLHEIEEKLSAVEARYSLAFAKAPIGMVLLTPEGILLEVNQAYVNSLGYTREELTVGDSRLFTHPDDVCLTRDFFASLRTGNQDTGSIEKRYFRKEGTMMWARASATMRRDRRGAPVEVIAIVEDITERKRAEQRLWESQAQLRVIYDGTYEHIGLLSLEGTVIDCNRASLQFAGNAREDVIGLPYWEAPWFAFTSGASASIREAVQLAATGQFVRYEATMQGASGVIHTFDLSLHPVWNERGEVVFLIPEGRDITEQNRAAQQIEEDRRRWRELLRQTPAGIALLRGPDHRFEWVNPDYERVVGRPSDALVGKQVIEALPEIDARKFSDLLDNVYTTGKPFVGQEIHVPLNRGDGALRDLWLNFVYLPTRDIAGSIDGIFVHVVDVTDTVLARRHIEESEIQFRTLAETIPHLAWMADESGARFWFNRRWYDYTGISPDRVERRGWEKIEDRACLPEILERWRVAVNSGTALEISHPLKGADGSFRSFLTRVEPVRDSEGRVVRWFGTDTDITDQRKTEEELRRMNRELEEFAYVASHDLREPLRTVNIYTEMILRDRKGDSENLARYGEFVKAGVARMEALIQDLLTFSRTVIAREVPAGRADLSEAFAEAMSVLKGRIEDSGAVVNAPVLPIVAGETSQLTHVFQNLLSNALKYRRTEVSPRIDVGAEEDGERWIISVRDNGIGFDPQYAERIFGLFKRLHTDEYPGTGLGLAICKRIVERYGGSMWAQGDPGAGAAFYFSLPAMHEGDE